MSCSKDASFKITFFCLSSRRRVGVARISYSILLRMSPCLFQPTIQPCGICEDFNSHSFSSSSGHDRFHNVWHHLQTFGIQPVEVTDNGFASIAAGTGNTGNILVNTEFALGKWFGKSHINGIRISAGSSTAFVDNDNDGADRDFNVNLCVDYLCNLPPILRPQKPGIRPIVHRRHRELFSRSGSEYSHRAEQALRIPRTNAAVGTHGYMGGAKIQPLQG